MDGSEIVSKKSHEKLVGEVSLEFRNNTVPYVRYGISNQGSLRHEAQSTKHAYRITNRRVISNSIWPNLLDNLKNREAKSSVVLNTVPYRTAHTVRSVPSMRIFDCCHYFRIQQSKVRTVLPLRTNSSQKSMYRYKRDSSFTIHSIPNNALGSQVSNNQLKI